MDRKTTLVRHITHAGRTPGEALRAVADDPAFEVPIDEMPATARYLGPIDIDYDPDAGRFLATFQEPIAEEESEFEG